MPAPSLDLPSSSTSSSGHLDGLGRRSLSFDRTTGAIMERLHVRPELAVFEPQLTQRVAALASLEEERFARPAGVARDPATGELTVLAEFITGSRLSDLLETSEETAAVPGVDVALGYLLESLPALSALHTTHRITHGLIDPSRTVLTPEGQVVFLDVALGPAVERLGLSRARLWAEFGVAAASGETRRVRFDPVTDIGQTALGALTLILGRNLRPAEYPDALGSLVMEVIEVAQIRGSSGFAASLQRFFQRALPFSGRRPYTTADEALVDIRHLVRREIGVDVCRQAIVDFVDHMERAFSTATPAVVSPTPAPVRVEHVATPQPPAVDDAPADEDDEEGVELEISLDALNGDGQPSAAAKAETEEIYDLSALDFTEADLPTVEVLASADRFAARDADHEDARDADFADLSDPRDANLADHAGSQDTAPLAEELARVEPPPAAPVAEVTAAPVEPIEAPAETIQTVAAIAVPVTPPPAPEPEPVPAPALEKETASSRRKKRQQQKSARARKDKLRSTTTEPTRAETLAEAARARAASPTGWMVAPPRGAAFEPTAPESPRVDPAPARAVPAVPSFVPTPVGALPQPVYTPSTPTTAYGAPKVAALAVPVARPAPAVPEPTPAASPVKLKTEPPAGFAHRTSTIAEARPIAAAGTLASFDGQATDDAARRFPWKLAAAAVTVAVVAIVAGRVYLPSHASAVGESTVQAATPPPAPVAAPPPEETVETPIPAGKGRLVLQTQPAGVKVLLDRKPIGETPLTIDVPAGRRMLTFATSGGDVSRPVRIVAGKALTMDLPVFSGWLAVFAPIVLDVAENGQTIGTTEHSRLLPPGRHDLTLSNKDLGYSLAQTVDIEAGAVKSLNLDPRGTANLNAVPWAEVWLDGQKLGDTPLASKVSLGLHEFVFKHPQHGERKVSATIRATAPSPVSVDFTR